ncbi:MAG: DUF6316 family protein [Pseudomonadota bacterium]
MQTQKMRATDREVKAYFRSSDRVFRLNDAWYFASREGDHGPFASEMLATLEVERYVSERTELGAFADRQAQGALGHPAGDSHEGARSELDEVVEKRADNVIPLYPLV